MLYFWNIILCFKANLDSAAATAAESQQRLAQIPDPSALYPELNELRQYKVLQNMILKFALKFNFKEID